MAPGLSHICIVRLARSMQVTNTVRCASVWRCRDFCWFIMVVFVDMWQDTRSMRPECAQDLTYTA
jgi:hypothetical protein